MSGHAHVGRGDASEAIWFADSLVSVLADAASTGGHLGVMHVHGPGGAGSPTHTHLAEDESWYVLEGELRFWLDDVEITARAGDFVFGPRGVAHRFAVTSPEARFLILVNPGGFEGFVRSTGWRASQRTLPPENLPPHPTDHVVSAVHAHRLLIDELS